jgi:hypothetical protein
MTEPAAPTGAKRLLGRATNLVATLVGVGVILAAGTILLEDGPMDSALALFAAGLVLLPFIPVPGRGSRLVVFVLGLGLAIGLPVMDSLGVHNQSVAAVKFARDAAAALTQAAVKGGLWPTDPKTALPDTLPVEGGSLERDLRVDACGGPACILVVTLTDKRYKPGLRGHSFELWTFDGGKTWACGPGGERPVAASDLPSTCRDGNPL